MANKLPDDDSPFNGIPLSLGACFKSLEEIVRDYPRLLSEKNLDAWEALFDPLAIVVKTEGGRIVRCQNISDAMPEQREYAAENEQLLEEWANIQVHRHGSIAVIKADYSLTSDHEIRRGVDVLTLVQSEPGWRIINLAYDQVELIQR